MPGFARRAAVVGGVVAVLSLGSAALAESVVAKADIKAAESRLAWAKRHIELVCRPLEAKQLFDRAARCYNDVSRLVGDVSQPIPATANARKVVRVASAPRRLVTPPVRRIAVRPVIVADNDAITQPFPAISSSRTCSGISCLQRYTLLGVGF